MKKLLLVVTLLLSVNVNAYYNERFVPNYQCGANDLCYVSGLQEYYSPDGERLVPWDEYVKTINYNPNEWVDFIIKVKIRR